MRMGQARERGLEVSKQVCVERVDEKHWQLSVVESVSQCSRAAHGHISDWHAEGRVGLEESLVTSMKNVQLGVLHFRVCMQRAIKTAKRPVHGRGAMG